MDCKKWTSLVGDAGDRGGHVDVGWGIFGKSLYFLLYIIVNLKFLWGMGVREVAQIMYTHVSKSKNDKTLKKEKRQK
jgi:hypothetical protein